MTATAIMVLVILLLLKKRSDSVKMYDYLVAYHFTQQGCLSFSTGTMQISRKKKIKTFEDIREVNKFITDSIEGASNVAVYNFILLGRYKH